MSLHGQLCCCSSDDCRVFGCRAQRQMPDPNYMVPCYPPSYGPSYPPPYGPSYYTQTLGEPPEVTLARAIERLAAAIERMAQSAPAAHAEAAE
jgi:hypothetical protein